MVKQDLSGLVLNEVLADPPPGLTGDANGDGVRVFQEDEFVEFFNAGDHSIDLSGFKLYDSQALRHVFPANTILKPYQALVVFGRPSVAGNLGDFGDAIVQNSSESSEGSGDGLSLTNGGDRVILRDIDGEIVIDFSYGDAAIDQSLTRSPDITGSELNIPHSEASSSRLLFSPGKNVNGLPFLIRTIGFDRSSQLVLENSDSILIELNLEGLVPQPTAEISVDLVLVEGNKTDIGGFESQTIIFPAGQLESRMVAIPITDDVAIEDREEFIFELRNLVGDSLASQPVNNRFRLIVEDNDQSLSVGFSELTSVSREYRQSTQIPIVLSGKNFSDPIQVIVSLVTGNASFIDGFSSDTLVFNPQEDVEKLFNISWEGGADLVQSEKFTFQIEMLSGTNVNGLPVTVDKSQHELTISQKTGSHFFYVDAINGDDNNDGRTPETAWQNLVMVNFYPEFPPNSRILLKSGSYWLGQLRPRGSGNGLDSVNIIDRYGSGPRPIIDGNELTGEGVVRLFNQEYWEISGLELTNPSDREGDRRGLEIKAGNFGLVKHIHIKDMYIHHISGIPSSDNSGKQTGGIYVATTNDEAVDTRFDDLLIENCIIHDCENQGIVTNNEVEVGFRPDSPEFERRRFTNVVIRGNTIYNISKNAMIIRLTDEGLIEHNLCYNTALNGITGNTMFCRTTRNTVFQFNEGYGNQSPSIDGSMYDADFSTFGSTFQYSYSHDNNHGLIWYATKPYDKDITVRYNISQNDKGRLVALRFDFVNTAIYNNVFYIGPDVSPVIIHERAGRSFSYQYYNNIIYNLSPTARYEFDPTPSRDIDNNLFYGIHPASEPEDANRLTTDPLFLDPGNGAIGLHTLEGYKLLQNSPAIGAGRIVPGNGGRDFFGHHVTSDQVPNIGAYNGPGLDTSNTGPILITNLALDIDSNTEESITQELLAANDPDHGPESITYRLLSLPQQGDLLLEGQVLKLQDTFNQLDINQGRLKYQNNFNNNLGDFFQFEVFDPDGFKISTTYFIINIKGLTTNSSSQPKVDFDLRFWPNPSSGRFNLDVESPYNGTLEGSVLSVSGRIIHRFQFEKINRFESISVEVDSFSNGVYYVRLEFDNGFIIKPIILKR